MKIIEIIPVIGKVISFVFSKLSTNLQKKIKNLICFKTLKMIFISMSCAIICIGCYHVQIKKFLSAKPHYISDTHNRDIVNNSSSLLLDILSKYENGIFPRSKEEVQITSYNFAYAVEDLFVSLCKYYRDTEEYKVYSIILNEYPSTNWAINGSFESIYKKLNIQDLTTSTSHQKALADIMYKRYHAIQKQIQLNQKVCPHVYYSRIVDSEKDLVDSKQNDIFNDHIKNTQNNIISLRHYEIMNHGLPCGLYYVIKFTKSDLFYVLYSFGDHQGDKTQHKTTQIPAPIGYALYDSEQFKNTLYYEYLVHSKELETISYSLLN
jgi:hypothetical protein